MVGVPWQVPEDRLGRLEQEHRTLALELRLTVSVAEEVSLPPSDHPLRTVFGKGPYL